MNQSLSVTDVAARRISATRQAQLETVATALWLVMDVLWMVEQPEASAAAGVVTLVLQAVLFRYIPRNSAEWAANGAVTCWVLMNLLWMLGDQWERPALVTAAWVPVIASFGLLAVALWSGGFSGPVTRRFRRFRFHRLSSGSEE